MKPLFIFHGTELQYGGAIGAQNILSRGKNEKKKPQHIPYVYLATKIL